MSAERLELARKMGATKAVVVSSKDPAEVAQQVRDTLGAMPDCAVEASGAQFSVQMAIRVGWSGWSGLTHSGLSTCLVEVNSLWAINEITGTQCVVFLPVLRPDQGRLGCVVGVNSLWAINEITGNCCVFLVSTRQEAR